MSLTQPHILQRLVAQTEAQRALQGLPPAELGTSENPSADLFTWANLVTCIRLILTVLFVPLYISRTYRLIALVLFALAASTDFLDGQIARRTKTVSWFGKLMDPIMDRILLFCGVVSLAYSELLPLWIVIYIVLRDVYLWIAGLLMRKRIARPLDVLLIGKACTACLMSGFVLCLTELFPVAGLAWCTYSWLPGLNNVAVPLGLFIIYLGIVLSIIATVLYTLQGLSLLTNFKALQRFRPQGF